MKTKILIPLAGVALFCACKGAGSGSESADSDVSMKEKVAPVNVKADSGRTAQTSQTFQLAQKLVKTARMRFKVKDVRQTSNQIADLTDNCDGTVMYHTINSIAGDSTTIRKTDDSLLKITIFNTTADMTVRIPSAKVESFVTQVAQMGLVVNSLKFEINDKTFDYLSTRLKLKNQKDRADIGANGGANLKDPDNLLSYKNHMVDQQISNLKTDDSVKNAVIALSFYEGNVVHKELIANPDLSAYNLPLSTRLGTSIKNGWSVFVEIMVELANFWVLAPVAGMIWLVVRYYNKRKKAVEVVKS
ncbi:MAG TPA: DUF4349 domain-containing protein [Mucilaginibacter sp.]|jgi:hypothetical protein|nr:DUF4349 domain-containing protein [Mucilaginibacter sp.]